MSIGNRCSGIALVIVLGLLALMMLLGVAFSTFMRTERLAAGNYKNDVRARQLLQAALARAITDIAGSQGAAAYPPWDVRPSQAATNGAPVVDVLRGVAREYVALGCLNEGGQHTGSGNSPDLVDSGAAWPDDTLTNGIVVNLSDGSWGVITDNGEAQGGKLVVAALHGGVANLWQQGDAYRIVRPEVMPQWIDVSAAGTKVGRFAYMAFNTSGLLDANYAGGSARGGGFSPAELQIEALPEMLSTTQLIMDRPYETVQELGVLETNRAFACWPSHFVTWSRFLSPTGALWIGGTADELLNSREDIVRKFRDDCNIGADADNQDEACETAFQNLLDYVDADSRPRYLDQACTESVPMVNEVALYYQLNVGAWPDSQWQCAAQMQVEYAYPFVTTNNATFRLRYDQAYEGGGPGGFLPPAVSNQIAPHELPPGQLPVYGSFEDLQMQSWTCTYSNQLVEISFVLRPRLQIEMKEPGATDFDVVVDQAPASELQPKAIPVHIGPIDRTAYPDGISTTLVVWAECLDPRFNWDPDRALWFARQWVNHEEVAQFLPNAQPTLNVENNVVGFMRHPDPAILDPLQWRDLDTVAVDDTRMYVANRPLGSVGELGYLAYGPWQTIRLYQHSGSSVTGIPPYHRVLDHFTVATNSKALVNPNTRSAEVLIVAFTNMPQREYATDPAQQRPVTAVGLSNVVSAILALRAGGSFNQFSQLGETPWDLIASSEGYPNPTELDKESYIRNSVGLLGVRENYFAILLFAQITKDVTLPDGRPWVGVLSQVRAVAEVWRDPVANTEEGHPTFVRSFRILKE